MANKWQNAKNASLAKVEEGRRQKEQKRETKAKRSEGQEFLATSRIFGGSGRALRSQRSRYTADEVMLALANQKIGHEARDYFRSRTGVDFYFGSITRLVGRARRRGLCTGTSEPQGTGGQAMRAMLWAALFFGFFYLFSFFLLSKYLSPPSIASFCLSFELHGYFWPDNDGHTHR